MTMTAQTIDNIGFAAAFCTTVAFVPQLLRVRQASIGSRHLAGNLSAVFGRRISLAALRHLQRIETGNCIERSNVRFIAEHPVPEDALRSSDP